MTVGVQIGQSLRLIHIFIIGGADWLHSFDFSRIYWVSVISFNPQLAVFNLESCQKVDELEVLITHQFLEYFVAKCFIDEYIGFLEVREQNDIHFFGRSTNFNEVDYPTDIMEVTVKHFPLLVASGEKTVFYLHGLRRLLPLEKLDDILRVAGASLITHQSVMFLDSSYAVGEVEMVRV